MFESFAGYFTLVLLGLPIVTMIYLLAEENTLGKKYRKIIISVSLISASIGSYWMANAADQAFLNIALTYQGTQDLIYEVKRYPDAKEMFIKALEDDVITFREQLAVEARIREIRSENELIRDQQSLKERSRTLIDQLEE